MPSIPFERYQFKPFIGSSHTLVLRELAALPHDCSVLDVGAGSGVFGRLLKERGCTQVDAVEPDAATRAQITPAYRQVYSELPDAAGKSYQVILLLDVLEHTAAPEAFLQKILELLAPEGRLIVSVPNIAHWSVRIPLFFGRFSYTDRGILDRTHLQFFDRFRFNALFLKHPQLVIEKRDVTIEPAEFLLPKQLWDNAIFRGVALLRLAAARLLPGLLGYQMLIIARKTS